MGLLLLLAATIMLLAGDTVLRRWIGGGFFFLLYWTVCMMLTSGAIVVAGIDALVVRRRAQGEHEKLLRCELWLEGCGEDRASRLLSEAGAEKTEEARCKRDRIWRRAECD